MAEPEDTEKGGQGSGNFGHAGRAGEVGGSASDSGGASSDTKPADWKPVRDAGYLGADAPPFAGEPINPNGKDSLAMYTGSDGKQTPEREALHVAIIDKAFEGKTPVDKPTVFLMGGGPASGKSEILSSGELGIPTNSVEVNSDKIKADFPEYQKMLEERNPNSAPFTHEESSEVSKDMLTKAVNGGYNTVLDGTGDSDLAKLENKIAMMKQAGAQVVANYCTVDVKTALERNLMRAEKTGRYVPESVIKETYKSLATILPQAIEKGLYDKFAMWDNNGKPPVKIASAEGKNFVIHDQKAWDRFLKNKDVK
jgi:predicted ABC-type ATPase